MFSKLFKNSKSSTVENISKDSSTTTPSVIIPAKEDECLADNPVRTQKIPNEYLGDYDFTENNTLYRFDVMGMIVKDISELYKIDKHINNLVKYLRLYSNEYSFHIENSFTFNQETNIRNAYGNVVKEFNQSTLILRNQHRFVFSLSMFNNVFGNSKWTICFGHETKGFSAYIDPKEVFDLHNKQFGLDIEEIIQYFETYSGRSIGEITNDNIYYYNV